MTIESKEGLSGFIEKSKEILGSTKQSLSLLEKETRIGFFKKASDWIKSIFGDTGSESQTSNNNTKPESQASNKNATKQKENLQQGGDKISEGMFKELLHMEGSQNFVAKSHRLKYGEEFVTGPYGMVYKYLDSNGNPLKKVTTFKNGEKVTKEWAVKNARAHYNECAKKRKKTLDQKGLKYNQNELDSLVSASGGTTASKKKLKSYVLSHWNNKNDIFNFMSKFATTAAGNGKTMPGLVRRRKFEANWFRGNKQPFDTYRA